MVCCSGAMPAKCNISGLVLNHFTLPPSRFCDSWCIQCWFVFFASLFPWRSCNASVNADVVWRLQPLTDARVWNVTIQEQEAWIIDRNVTITCLDAGSKVGIQRWEDRNHVWTRPLTSGLDVRTSNLKKMTRKTLKQVVIAYFARFQPSSFGRLEGCTGNNVSICFDAGLKCSCKPSTGMYLPFETTYTILRRGIYRLWPLCGAHSRWKTKSNPSSPR